MARAESRFGVRARVVGRALALRLVRGPRQRPGEVRRALVAHHLLVGDTLMLTPLLAKLRAVYPEAEIAMTVRGTVAPLYAGRPYGVDALPFDPRDAAALGELLEGTNGFDLAIVPGDNRYSWLAAALDAAWVVAFAGDRPAAKNWMVDELVPFPEIPTAWADMNPRLVPGNFAEKYHPADWPAPPFRPFEMPSKPFAVFHVGAGSPLRLWSPENWRALASRLRDRVEIVVSAGPGEEGVAKEIDPQAQYRSYAGQLDLAQLWHLLAAARLLVTLDTGVAHLAKLVGVPTLALFGPGSAVLFGKGRFWRDAPFHEVTLADFPCRDQRTLFKRETGWVRRCQRSTSECADARCMRAIGVEEVSRLADAIL